MNAVITGSVADTELFGQVCSVILLQLGVQRPLQPVTPQTLLAQDLGVDSLDRVEISMALEDEFNIKVPFDHESAELDKCETIQDVIDLVKKKLEVTV